MNFTLKRTQVGISLLEIMLALAVVTVVLVIATRFFLITNISNQVNNATDQINGTRGGAISYLNDTENPTGLSIMALASGDYLPESFKGTGITGGGGVNPWGGDLKVAVPTTDTLGRTFIITETAMPKSACEMLVAKLDKNLNTSVGEKVVSTCTDTTASNQVAVTYHR